MRLSYSQNLAGRVAIIYAFFGALWILFSDQILAMLVMDTGTLTQLQTLKGWFYVTVTAALVYFLVERGARIEFNRRERSRVEREQLIKQLELRNSELEQYAYTVSHDLKTPLITINTYLGALQEDLAARDTTAIEDDMQRIGRAVTTMGRLLDDVLQLSRVGQPCETPQMVAMRELVDQALELASPKLQQHGIQVDVAPNLPMLFGDRRRLLQVFQNLIDNAAKFVSTTEKPRIEISGRLLDREVVCMIRDNGIGIDPSYHQRVFELFDQLDPSIEGSGVGLALVKRIIDVHHGRIWIESAGVGHGSTVSFSLPAGGEWAT